MDPVIAYQLGQIRHQELIDEAALYRRGEAIGLISRLIAMWQRLNITLDKAPAKTPECAPQPNLISTSR